MCGFETRQIQTAYWLSTMVFRLQTQNVYLGFFLFYLMLQVHCQNDYTFHVLDVLPGLIFSHLYGARHVDAADLFAIEVDDDLLLSGLHGRHGKRRHKRPFSRNVPGNSKHAS